MINQRDNGHITQVDIQENNISHNKNKHQLFNSLLEKIKQKRLAFIIQRYNAKARSTFY